MKKQGLVAVLVICVLAAFLTLGATSGRFALGSKSNGAGGSGAADSSESALPDAQDDESDEQASKDGSAPEASDDEAEADAGTSEEDKVEKRTAIALEFAETWNTTGAYNPEDDIDTWALPDWLENCMSYVAPDSVLYAEFDKARQGLFEGPGAIAAISVAKSAELVSVEGDSYTVRVIYAATQNRTPGWTEIENETVETYVFDANDKIIQIQTPYSTWGEV